MSPGFEFSLGDANLALIVASLFSLDARFLDHAAPFLVVRLDLLERLRGGQDLGVAAGGVDLVEQVLVRPPWPAPESTARQPPAAGRRGRARRTRRLNRSPSSRARPSSAHPGTQPSA